VAEPTARDHDHSHQLREAGKRNLTLALVLIVGYMFAEIVGGIISGSLALIADAGHMLADAASIALALAAMHFSTRAASRRRTFGYHRLEVLAALVNGATLWGISVWILIEAYGRFTSTPQVQGGLVLGIGSIGLVVNIVAASILHRSARHSVNIEGAYQHVIADLLGSVAVVLSGVLVWAFGWHIADPILSALIGVLILVSTWRLLAKVVHVLLEGAPDHVDLDSLCRRFEEVEGVNTVHDIHVWTLAPGYEALTAHVTVRKGYELQAGDDTILNRLRDIAYGQFNLQHVTLQLETSSAGCPEDHRQDFLPGDPNGHGVARPHLESPLQQAGID